jgi:hypothetical protein
MLKQHFERTSVTGPDDSCVEHLLRLVYYKYVLNEEVRRVTLVDFSW